MSLSRIFFSRDQKHLEYLQQDVSTPGHGINFLCLTNSYLAGFHLWLSQYSEVVVDIETTSIDPYCGKILLISFYSDNKVITFDTLTISVELIFSNVNLSKIRFIGHNIKFEYLWFLKHKIHLPLVYCTMIAEQKLLQGVDVKHNIIDVLTRRNIPLPPAMNKAIREEFSNGMYKKPEIYHILYNQGDIIPLIELKEVQEKLMDVYKLRFLIYNIHFPLIRVLALAEMEGMVLDEPRFIDLAQKAEDKMNSIGQQMEAFIKQQFPTVNLATYNKPIAEKIEQLEKRLIRLEDREVKCLALVTRLQDQSKTHLKAYTVTLQSLSKIASENKEVTAKVQELGKISSISWTSGDQVLTLLIALGCKVLPKQKDKKTKVFKPSLAKAPRERWLLQNRNDVFYPFFKLYDEYMRETKHVNSFGKTFIEKYKHPVTGKFHTSYKQGTVETGRLASGDSNATPPRFNSQQLPPIIRDCFKTDSGYIIGKCDLSGAELVMMCSLAQDQHLLELSKTQDLHSYFANLGWRAIYKRRGIPFLETDVISKEQHSEKRRAYKPQLFGVVYGLRGAKAAETLNITLEEGEIAIKTIEQEIPETLKMVKTASKFAIENGYIIHNTRTNSRRWFSKVIDHLNGAELSFLDKIEAESAARNTKIQGSQADMLCEAMVLLQRYIDRYKIDAKILMQVHDELVVKFRSEDGLWFARRIKDCMIRTANKYLEGGVTMDAELKVKDTWQ